MSKKDFDRIAAFEKAIRQKYGDEAIKNPKANWGEEKEKEYLSQMREFYNSLRTNALGQEKVEVNGIKISKKLLNRESLRYCYVCVSIPKKSMDDVCLTKFECCHKCHVKYIEGREERWLKGWRPKNG